MTNLKDRFSDDVVVYMRASLAEEAEFSISSKYFRTTNSRLNLPYGALVIPRYSALPFYKELEADVKSQNAQLINSFTQHLYVADIKNWYEDLKDITPKTYFNLADVPNKGSFVVKGATNSRKNLWDTHMFAKTKEDVSKVYCRLADDTMISEQDIYVRDYVPLKRLNTGVNGLPISIEHRFFFLGNKVIASGFYWHNFIDELCLVPEPNEVPKELLEEIGNKVSKHINFFVADIAQTEEGRWILIELNDGQMSGLSCVDPDELYKNLKEGLLL